MAYLGDPRENSIDLNDHAIWESDNRVEERYLWNGSVIDLCDLPVEEYMKNPIIEAIENSGGGGSSKEVLDALSEDTDKILSGISASTEQIIESMSGGGTPTQAIPFYYAAKNHNTPISNLTINDFESASTYLNEEYDFVFTLEDPSYEDYQRRINGEIDDTEYRELSYNTLYVLVPSKYVNKTVLKNLVEVEFTPVESSILDGFSLLENVNDGNMNDGYDEVKGLEVGFTIKIRR